MSFRRLGHRRLARGVFLGFDRRYLIDGHGNSVARDVIRHPGGVAVLPVNDDRVWLVNQHRTAAGSDLLEIPAGRLDPLDRDPLAGGKRELAEEIGATASAWIWLTTMYPSPGYTDETLAVFAATGLTFSDRRPDGAEEEQLSVVSCGLDEALDRIETGEIADGKTQIALLIWARRRSKL